jgi:hypothetical protein
VHAFNIFTVAERDLPALRALHLELFNRVRVLADSASASERVVLYSAQILALDRDGEWPSP